jgi:hypothetical protein
VAAAVAMLKLRVRPKITHMIILMTIHTITHMIIMTIVITTMTIAMIILMITLTTMTIVTNIRTTMDKAQPMRMLRA